MPTESVQGALVEFLNTAPEFGTAPAGGCWSEAVPDNLDLRDGPHAVLLGQGATTRKITEGIRLTTANWLLRCWSLENAADQTNPAEAMALAADRLVDRQNAEFQPFLTRGSVVSVTVGNGQRLTDEGKNRGLDDRRVWRYDLPIQTIVQTTEE